MSVALSNFAVSSDVSFWKPTSFTVVIAGKSTVFSPAQPENAFIPTVVTNGNLTLVSDVQS